MIVDVFTPLTSSEITSILLTNDVVIQDALQSVKTKQNLLLTLTQDILNKLSDAFGFQLQNPIPAQVVKGDTSTHVDVGPTDFEYTYLMYLTDSEGSLFIEDQEYPIAKGQAYQFSSGMEHGTQGTGDSLRLSIGPFNEFQNSVGGPGFQYFISEDSIGTIVSGVFDTMSDPYTLLAYENAGANLGPTPVVPTNKVFAGWSLDPSGTTVDYTAGQSISVNTSNSYSLYPVFTDAPSTLSPCLQTCATLGSVLQTKDRTANDKETYTQDKNIYVDHVQNLNAFGQRRQFADYASYLKYISGKAKIGVKQNQSS